MILLEKLRVDALLTPEQLGERVGLAGGTIRRIEQGKGAHMGTLRKLVDWARVPASELLQEVAAESKVEAA